MKGWMGKQVFVVVILNVFLMLPVMVQAAEVNVGADASNAYVWRGITFNDEGVVQPYVDIAHESGIGLNIWANFDMGDFGGAVESGEFSEVDLTLSYAVPLPVEEIDFSLGVIHYLFPQGAATTTELYGSATVAVYGPLSVGSDFYYDVDEISDFYLTVNTAVDLSSFIAELMDEKLSLEISALLGFSSDGFAGAYGGTKSGVSHVDVGASAGYSLTDSVELTGFVTWTDNVKKEVLPEQNVEVFGGGGLSYTF